MENTSSASSKSSNEVGGGELTALDNVTRTSFFWSRSASIYLDYKLTQVKAGIMHLVGWDKDRIQKQIWDVQHELAAEKMYKLCVDLRGFYLKSGQFLGARGDFVPEQICRKLSLLHDQVPPMPAKQAKEVIEMELGGIPLDAVFEWIDLSSPLGSASISQVHKGKLRQLPRSKRSRSWKPLRILWPFFRSRPEKNLQKFRRSNESTSLDDFSNKSKHRMKTKNASKRNNSEVESLEPVGNPPFDLELAWQGAPKDGIVAVKVQYPNALPTMSLDLKNLRLLAAFLSKTELRFDMVSAVNELAKQIKLEFDFCREARIMDAVARQFDGLGHKICVPKSVPGMVTPRLLVMSYLDGIPITRLKDRIEGLSEATKRLASRRILDRVSEAYGRMILLDGLFQADGHPGNIMVMKKGVIGLIDYGQSKRLPDAYRASFAKLVKALASETDGIMNISEALDGLGVVTERQDHKLKAEMARGMFDTSGKVDPFDPESPIKKMGIETFPADMFFVLRVVQLLRGLANGMNITDFSCAKQWKPFASDALKQLENHEFSSVDTGLNAFVKSIN